MPLQIDLAVPVTLLVLIGGGEFSFGETREIDEFLLSKMAPERKTIAFLPTASGSAEYAQHLGSYLQQIDPSVQTVNVPVYRGRDARRRRSLDLIANAGMVYLGGGVTNSLLAAIRESATDLAMREAAANGTVVAAIGAAASCFGAHARDMAGTASAIPGLQWLSRTVVDTSFDPENDSTLRRLMSIPDVELGLGIPPGTALAIAAGGATEVIGSGRIAAFRKPR